MRVLTARLMMKLEMSGLRIWGCEGVGSKQANEENEDPTHLDKKEFTTIRWQAGSPGSGAARRR